MPGGVREENLLQRVARLLTLLENKKAGGVRAEKESRSCVLLLQDDGSNRRSETSGQVNKSTAKHPVAPVKG